MYCAEEAPAAVKKGKQSDIKQIRTWSMAYMGMVVGCRRGVGIGLAGGGGDIDFSSRGGDFVLQEGEGGG